MLKLRERHHNMCFLSDRYIRTESWMKRIKIVKLFSMFLIYLRVKSFNTNILEDDLFDGLTYYIIYFIILFLSN